MSEVIIEHRFHGPPDSGNGGYVCGLLAEALDGVAEVTLRQPPPLDVPLELTVENAAGALTRDGVLIASARPGSLDLEVPEPLSLSAAREAANNYTGFHQHIFPSCFVCGPQREPGDGMRIFPGEVRDAPDIEGIVAAPWTPDGTLADEGGLVRNIFLWAALDCPGYFAVGKKGEAAVLGRMTAEISGTVMADKPYIVMAWPTGLDGRKLYSGTAIFDADGTLIAKAAATWIKIGSEASFTVES